MKLRTILNWAKKDETIKQMIDFYSDRFLGEVLSIDDLYDEELDLKNINDTHAKEFSKFFKTELYKRGTRDFLRDKEYPEPNYAGIPYPCWL